MRGEGWPGPRDPSVVNLLQICVLSVQRKAVSLFTEPIVGRRKADEQEHTCFCADTHMRIPSMASRTGTREFKMAMHVVQHRPKAVMARKDRGYQPMCMHVMAKFNPCFVLLSWR